MSLKSTSATMNLRYKIEVYSEGAGGGGLEGGIEEDLVLQCFRIML